MRKFVVLAAVVFLAGLALSLIPILQARSAGNFAYPRVLSTFGQFLAFAAVFAFILPLSRLARRHHAAPFGLCSRCSLPHPLPHPHFPQRHSGQVGSDEGASEFATSPTSFSSPTDSSPTDLAALVITCDRCGLRRTFVEHQNPWVRWAQKHPTLVSGVMPPPPPPPSPEHHTAPPSIRGPCRVTAGIFIAMTLMWVVLSFFPAGKVLWLLAILMPLAGFAPAAAIWWQQRRLDAIADDPTLKCPRCEHPLPVDGQPDDHTLTCTECGLTQTRAQHRAQWSRELPSPTAMKAK